MNVEPGNHARLRKKDSEQSIMSTPTYGGEYIDRVSELYSSPKERTGDYDGRSYGENSKIHQTLPATDDGQDIYEAIDGYENVSPNVDRPNYPVDIGARELVSQETDHVNDAAKTISFEPVNQNQF